MKMCLVLVFFTTCKKIYFFGNIKKETKRLNILGLVLLFYKKVCYTRENAFENLDFVKM